MHKINKLIIMLFALTGWSQHAYADEVQASTNLEKPEHVYRVHCARQNQTKYWSQTGAPVDEAKAGSFALMAASRAGDYYIYNAVTKEYLSYTPSNIGNKRNFAVNVKTNPQPWKLTSATVNEVQFYEIQPYNTSGTPEMYANWYQGISGTHTSLGLWQENGTQDKGSAWAFEEISITLQTFTIRIVMPEGYTGDMPTVSYQGKTYANEDSFEEYSAPAAKAFSAPSLKGYFPTVSIAGNDVIVSYNPLPNYTLYSDGMPATAYITIAGEQYRNVNAQGETQVDGSQLMGMLAESDIAVACGGGYDYSVIVDNLNAQITVNFTQIFLPTEAIDAEKKNLYRIKDTQGRYPRMSSSNILATKTKSNGDKFILVESDKMGEYYIYNVTKSRYLYYTQTTGTANTTTTSSSAIKTVSSLGSLPASAGATWKIRKESYSGTTVDIYPAKGDGKESWNFRGGDSYALNLYDARDGNSSWTLEDPNKGALACATYMYALPGAQYMHKLIPENGIEVVGITSLTNAKGSEAASFTLHDERKNVGNKYKYVTGEVPNEEGIYSYKALLSDNTEATITLTVSSKLASPTPMMGWLSWNWFAENINTQRMTDIAQGLVDKGLVAAGYKYLVLDDGWGTSNENSRTDKENLRVNTAKFADMKAFAQKLNSVGLRLGLYSDAGSKTCGGFQPGSYGFENQHVQLFADCGADFLKYDFCNSQAGAKISYQQMGDAIRMLNAKRKTADPEGYTPFSFNACEWGSNEPWKWAAEAGADSWRSTQDARECWMGNVSNLIGVIDGIDRVKYLWMWAGVNRFNDLDMMCIGIHGYGGPSNHIPSHRANGGKIEGFSEEQARSQMSLWCMLSSPLAITADVRKRPENYYGQTLPSKLVTDTDLEILTNSDIISISQDELGQQAEFLPMLSESTNNDPSGIDVYIKDLKDGEKALAVFNRGSARAAARTIAPASIYMGQSETVYFKNVWTGAIGELAPGSNIEVPALKPYETYVVKLRTSRSYDESSTSIQTVPANTTLLTEKDAIYDLQGRKVTKPMPGTLYLQGGKKLIF